MWFSHMFARHNSNNTNKPNARLPPDRPTAATDLGPLVGRLSLTHDSKRQHPKSGAQLSADPFSTLPCQTSSRSPSSPFVPNSMLDMGQTTLCVLLPSHSTHALLSRSNRKQCPPAFKPQTMCLLQCQTKPRERLHTKKSFDVTLDAMSHRVIPVQLA